MLFALDYDGTYTAAPGIWDDWIKDVRKHGHTVALVTMRHNTDAERVPLVNVDMVIYTGRKAKAKFCEMLDLQPDVWIDDHPYSILHDHP